MKVKVSIIVTSYNYVDYIRETLDSIMAQSFRNWEAIVIDDGSTDNSVKVISEYVARDSRFRLLQHKDRKNKGLPASVECAVRAAKGEYIAFCESDDALEPDCLEKHLAVFERHPDVVLSFSNVELVGEKEFTLPYQQHIDGIRRMLFDLRMPFDPRDLIRKHNPVFTFSSVIAKAAPLKRCDFDPPYPPFLDWWLWRQLSYKGEFAYTDEKLAKWRIHGSSLMRSVDDSHRRAQQVKSAMDELLKDECMVGRDRKGCFLWREERMSNGRKVRVAGVVVYRTQIGPDAVRRRLLGIRLSKRFIDPGLRRLHERVRKYRLLSFFPVPVVQKRLKRVYRRCKNDFLLALQDAHEMPHARYVGVSANEMSLLLHYRQTERERVLLVSHSASNMGAPRALLEAARLLKKNRYNVVFFSPLDGPVKAEAERDGIPFLMDEGLNYPHFIENHVRKFREFASLFDLVIVNSAFNVPIARVLKGVHVRKVWWLHEGSYYFRNDAPSPEIFMDLCGSMDAVFSVGDYAISCTDAFVGQPLADNLLYGVPDQCADVVDVPAKRDGDVVVFGILGTLEPRKCQLEFARAMAQLPDPIRRQARFVILGDRKAVPDYSSRIEEVASMCREITIIGDLPHREFLDELSRIDVVVSFSSDDPMPIVLTEAIMNRKVIICTDRTGTSSMIEDGVNGFVVASGDTEALKARVEFIINNKAMLADMGGRGRRIYDDYFALDQFEANLLKAVDKVLSAPEPRV